MKMPSSRDAGAGAHARKRSEGSDALGRLQRGEMTLEEYLDFRADESVRGLRGRVSAERLALVRDEIREQLSDDPVLLEMVRQVTTAAPGRAK